MWPARLDAAAALACRVLLSAIFLHEAYAKLTAYGMSQTYMKAFGVPPNRCRWQLRSNWLRLLVLVGYRRIAALLLAGSPSPPRSCFTQVR
jgi:uncharacterized membrane protein YphA (DoxX/SURF4 family)